MCRHRETVSFHPLLQALCGALLAATVWAALQSEAASGDRVILLPLGLLFLVIALIFGRLVIEVDEESLRVTWGFLGWPRKVIPLRIIEKTEPVTYKPLRQFGGWGIRSGRIDGQTTAAYTLRGNRGLLLLLSEETTACLTRTRRFLLGTPQPERLQQTLGL